MHNLSVQSAGGRQQLQNETAQSIVDSAAFNTYKNALENTVRDISGPGDTHQMSSSNEDQQQQLINTTGASHPQIVMETALD